MSRSVHHTLKSVFGEKSKREIEEMIFTDDPDLLEYIEKRRIKQRARDLRSLKAVATEFGEELPDVLHEEMD